MAGFRQPRPTGSHSVIVDDGTLCRSESSKPGATGTGRPSSPTFKRKLKVLGFDGDKVHEFLFHVALSEIQWQDLEANPDANPKAAEQKGRALKRASALYDLFLEACSKGAPYATSFLAKQHDAQKEYLQKSQVILSSLQVKAARREVVLSEVAFGAQAVKSAATAGVAIIGLFLVGPEVIAGAGIALAFDVSMELINHLGSSGEAHADAVVVGFKQAVANDAVSLAGSAKQVGLDETKSALAKTLQYSLKSSTYRAAAETAGRLDVLLKVAGGLAAAVTMYTEFNASKASWDEMQKTRGSYAAISK
jgi:hypothetical protein